MAAVAPCQQVPADKQVPEYCRLPGSHPQGAGSPVLLAGNRSFPTRVLNFVSEDKYKYIVLGAMDTRTQFWSYLQGISIRWCHCSPPHPPVLCTLILPIWSSKAGVRGKSKSLVTAWFRSPSPVRLRVVQSFRVTVGYCHPPSCLLWHLWHRKGNAPGLQNTHVFLSWSLHSPALAMAG